MSLLIQINLLLGITGALSFLSEKMLRLFGVRVSSHLMLRFSQALLIGSLTIPVVLKYLPSQAIQGAYAEKIRLYSDAFPTTLKLPTKPKISSSSSSVTVPIPKAEVVINYRFLLGILWGMGSLFFFSLFFRNYLRLDRIVHASVLMKNFRNIRIVSSSEVFVPFSVRLRRHFWIVLPESLLSNKGDLDLAIKHEMQHHRQGDTTWAIFMELLGCFFYFNPAMYLWKNTITELQEYACDESLTGQNGISSHAYGSCLLRVAETALEHRQMYAGTTSMAAIIRDSKYFRKFLMRRIEMITEERSSRRSWIAALAGLSTIIATVTVAIGAEKIARHAHGINPGVVKVDPAIQKISDDVLTRALARYKATAGFIIVSEPSTGKVLAVSNMDLVSKRKGYWILSELMETASIAKPLVVSQAIEEGRVNLESTFDCENGSYNHQGQVYHDWKQNGWKSLNTLKTIANSSNICAIKIGQSVGVDGINGMFDKLGFGEGGIAESFPEARTGERPQKDNPQFIPQATIGVGFKSTPLEVLQAYGAIANGGDLMKPISPDQAPKVVRKVLQPSSVEKMRELLRFAVTEGTGRNANSDLYLTAGKTASNYLDDFMSSTWPKALSNYAGFIGFAPLDKPAIAVYVGIINPNSYRFDAEGVPHDGAHGGAHAAPVFKEVVENVLTHLKVKPDRI